MKNWSKYQEKNCSDVVNNLLLEFLDKYSVRSAIDFGCGSGNDSVYLLNKGIDVVCIDKQLNKNLILDRLNENHGKVTFIENSFEEVLLPKTDALFAFFSLPFCSSERFDLVWDKIYSAINDDGYFVGQLFGNRDGWSKRKNINTFTKEEALKYLEKYEVILFDEIEYEKPGEKKWHFYNIIAKKNIK